MHNQLKLLFTLICLVMTSQGFAFQCRDYEAFPDVCKAPAKYQVEFPARTRGFYFGGFVGTWSSPEESPIFFKFAQQNYIGGSVGYRFLAPWRIEGEFTYRHSTPRLLKIDAIAGMGNIFRDFRLWGFNPYLGAGFGYFRADELFKKFAFQLLFGVSYPLRKRLLIGIEYRYFQPCALALGIHGVGFTTRIPF